ncbi:cyclin-domain-containing protein [Boletus reticuloceps]|uniref:Cyclin-domain-containing protein n=1 Tax=Boletus reticuloceps TaxID=495285 RepID=A0A8I2YNX5_9AGAM|nr:cyclin-domain-containing protein [Boletus reticuloceps]
MLERLIVHNDRIPLVPESLTRFHSRSAPGISVLDYLRRIIRFTKVEKSCLLLTLHYVDQICARMPLFTLSSLTCHRFIIASITVCSKGLCDIFCTNSLYARVGGIPVSELNVLEREFLRMIDWRLTCTREVLQEYYVNLVRTESSGRFFIPGSPPVADSSVSSESELESTASRSPSPSQGQSSTDHRTRLIAHMRSPSHHEPSTILIDTARRTPRVVPTLEQNMAFADLQSSLGGESGIPFGRS